MTGILTDLDDFECIAFCPQCLSQPSICPVHLSAEQDQWIADHKDPAFAEQIKEVHTHELPILYGQRIAGKWLEYFLEKQEYSATGIARAGISIIHEPKVLNKLFNP